MPPHPVHGCFYAVLGVELGLCAYWANSMPTELHPQLLGLLRIFHLEGRGPNHSQNHAAFTSLLNLLIEWFGVSVRLYFLGKQEEVRRGIIGRRIPIAPEV